MAKTWHQTKAARRSRHTVDEARVIELRRQMLAEVRAHRLAAIREAYGLNQTEVAQQLGLSQSRVSRIEKGDLDRSEVGTVRSYIEALGGQIEIVARFGDERITVA